MPSFVDGNTLDRVGRGSVADTMHGTGWEGWLGWRVKDRRWMGRIGVDKEFGMSRSIYKGKGWRDGEMPWYRYVTRTAVMQRKSRRLKLERCVGQFDYVFFFSVMGSASLVWGDANCRGHVERDN